MKKLNHQNIVKLHEVINDPNSDKLCLIMDYLGGGTMQEYLDKCPRGIPIREIRNFARQLISALVYCHEDCKVVHRDIKPENIMLNKDGEAVLVDFGVSALF